MRQVRKTIRDGLKGEVFNLFDYLARLDQRREFSRLTRLKWETIVRYGKGTDVAGAEGVEGESGGRATTRGTKRKSGSDDGRSKISNRKKSYCMTLA